MAGIESIGQRLEGEDQFEIELLARWLDPAWVAEALEDSGRLSKRRRKLPAEFVVWFVILLGLFRRVSYSNLLEKLHDTRWTSRAWGHGRPPTGRALTWARDRLGVEPMEYLFRRSAAHWEIESRGRAIAGLRCYALDGICMKVPDTDANRDHYGVPVASRGKSAFPQLRSAFLVDTATHLVRAERHAAYTIGELTLARQLLEDIYPGMLVIMDRNFHAYDFLLALQGRGADFLVRANRDRLKARAIEHLGRGDDIVWVRASTWARRQYSDVPRRVKLRRVVFRPRPGAEKIVLLTTVLDPRKVTAAELATGYCQRWEGESAFDEFKTHLCDCTTVNRPVVFRSKTPERIEQEYYGLLIAFNLLSMIKDEAAIASNAPAAEMSFVTAVERVREAVRETLFLPTAVLELRTQLLLKSIARSRFKRRPGRSHPRAVRVKMSGYPLKQGRAA